MLASDGLNLETYRSQISLKPRPLPSPLLMDLVASLKEETYSTMYVPRSLQKRLLLAERFLPLAERLLLLVERLLLAERSQAELKEATTPMLTTYYGSD